MRSCLSELHPDARARIEPLLVRGWSEPGEHPIGRLHGRRLGPYRLIALLGPKNNVGSHYFQLFLADRRGRLALEPLALGLHNSGPFPAYNWVELTQYRPILTFNGKRVDLATEGLDLTLFQLVSDLVPPGGHIMVEYDSPSQKATERVLTLGYPAACSPIGYLLLQAGCRSYRNWYIPEGGREGPRKLQGFKPLNDEIAAEKTALLRRELEGALHLPDEGEHAGWRRLARELAAKALRTIE